MVKYSCEICEKTFAQKGHLEDHHNRKRPCKKDNTIEVLVEQKVKEVLSKTNEAAIKNNTTPVEEIKETQITYSKKTREELIAICRENSIKKYSGKKKEDIIKLLLNHNEAKENTDIIIKVENKEVNEILNKAVDTTFDLVHGNCLIEMKKIADCSIDMILCDLPYGVTKNAWDVIIPFDALWKEYKRIIKNNGAILLFGSQPFTSLMVMSNLEMFRYSLVWEKNKFSDFLNSKRKPMKTNEDIAVFYKKQPIYNPQYWYSTPYVRWNTQTAVDKQTNYGGHKENYVESTDGKRLPTTVLKFNRIERPDHPTQKPVDLLEWLIKTYTNEGNIVLDNCMGVGSTGVACKNLKRSFIGIELNKKYFDIAVVRIRGETIVK